MYNRGADIALQIRRTAFTERCGLSVRDLTGRFGMDASGIVLSGLDLQTSFSRIRAELTAGAGILKLEPASPLDAVLSADLNTKDLKFLSPEAVPPVLDDRTVRLSFSAASALRSRCPGDDMSRPIRPMSARVPAAVSFIRTVRSFSAGGIAAG